MKKASLALVIGATLVLSACGNDKKTEEEKSVSVSYTTEAQKQSYALGARMGKFASDQVTATDDLGIANDKDALIAGFNDAVSGKSQYTEEEVQALVQAFSTQFTEAEQAAQQAAAAENIAAAAAYLVENGQREGVVTDRKSVV